VKPLLHILLPVLLVGLFLSSCSTEKNKALNRGYHNMTAHYNGYFNARELIKESLKGYEESTKEDFNKILPVYRMADEASASSLYPNMDKAIQKTSKVIDRHSMPNPKKKENKKDEWCKWIDDNWMVMAQAHFYKREFEAAIQKFEYVAKNYPDQEISYDAQLWLARTYMESGNMAEAQKILDKLQAAKENKADAEKEKENEDNNRPKNSRKKKPTKKKTAEYPDYLNKDLAATQAEFYIRKKEYEKAAEHLQTAIKLTKKKREKARLTYILAQVYQAQGQNQMASDTYAKIPKLNPTFEMEFYSRINRALLFEGGDSKGIRSELMKLLRDEKNKEYFDQIYYALAELDFRENQKAQGIADLKKSIEVSLSNDAQKGKSYVRLGEISFKDRDYVNAKNYYDSSLLFLPKTFDGLDLIRQRSEGLTELVKHLTDFQLNDSLVNLSKLSNKKKEELVRKIVEKENLEAEKRKQAEEAKAQAQNSGGSGAGDDNTKWYFYNPQAKQLGFAEFKKIWGTRKPEDDWRRSDRSSVSEESIAGNPEDTLDAKTKKDEKRIEDLLEAIPNSPDEISACREKIQYALYHAGVLYKDRFEQKDLAINSFKELVKRYDIGEYVLPANYQLYLLTNAPEQDQYKNFILENYPESEYAKLIKNPNLLKEGEARRATDEKEYLEAVRLYRERKYVESLQLCIQKIASEPENYYRAKYYYLRSLNYGELRQMDQLEISLSETAKNFPTDEVGKQSQAILDKLRNQKTQEEKGVSGYVYDASAEHWFVLVFPNSLGSINDAKAKFSDFNTSYFSNMDLKVSNPFLNADVQLILVKTLPDAKEAMKYYQAIKNENDKLKAYKSASYFMISAKNYATFYLDKDVNKYLSFFTANYLK
jgi:TolA-binding protein